VQRNVKRAGETKDPHRVRPHDRILAYVPHRAHEPIPEVTKLPSELYRRVFDPQLARGAQGVMEYRPRHRGRRSRDVRNSARGRAGRGSGAWRCRLIRGIRKTGIVTSSAGVGRCRTNGRLFRCRRID